MQLPSIASLLNDTSPEKVVLPSVKELEQLKVSNNNQTPNIENSTVVVQQGFKSYNNTIPSSFNNLYPISNSQQVSNNNQTHNQLTSYTCTSSTQQQNIPSSNNNLNLNYNYPSVTASTSQEDQRLQVSSTFLQQKDAYKNGMLKSHDIASDKYYDNYSNTRKWDESGSKLHSNPTSQPIPVYQNKWSTTTSNVSTSNSATFKPIISPTSRNSPLSFTPSIVTTASSSSNVSETKKKRKHDESSESTNSPNSSSPKLVKRNSGTSKKSSNSSSSSAPAAVASSFQFMNFSISSDSSKIKFVNSEHQQIGINDGSWTDQEHDDFVRGLNECGKGRWREIAEKYVKTRTRTQVASHAQKYFEAQKEKKK